MGPILGILMGLIFAFVPLSLVERWESDTLDARFIYRGNLPLQPNVIVIGIDDVDLDIYGQWPWSRADWAYVFRELERFSIEPSVVVLDVLFTERQGAKYDAELARLEELASAGLEDATRKWQDIKTKQAADDAADAAFAASLENRRVILASYSDMAQAAAARDRWEKFKMQAIQAASEGDAKAIESLQIAARLEDLLRDSDGALPALLGEPRLENLAAIDAIVERDTFGSSSAHKTLPRTGTFHPPIRALSQTAAGVGFVNVDKDLDGVIRKTYTVTREGAVLFPSLFLLAVCRHLDVDFTQVAVIPGGHIMLPARDSTRLVPIDEKGRVAINFRGPEAFLGEHNCFTFRSLMAGLMEMDETGEAPVNRADVMNPEDLNRAVVLIGMYSEGAPDFGIVPISAHYPRVALHANAIDMILSGQYLRPSARLQGWLRTILTIFFGIACGISVRYLTPIRGGISTLALMLIYPALCFQLFHSFDFVLPLVRPEFAVLGTFAGNAAFYFLVERRRRRRYGDYLMRHVSKNVAERILTGELDLVLSGERAKLAVLFSDIRGFTPLTQRVSAEEVVSLLSRYFGEMAEIVYNHDGTLDKFMGDGMMAFFGHPTAHEDDTLRAVKAALEMQKQMGRLQEEWEREGKEPLTIGIGISTGDVVVGDVGTDVRSEYTAIGPHVNLAFRLESLAPGGSILLSETAYAEVRDWVEARPLDPIQIKGIREPVTIYELVGMRAEKTTEESRGESHSKH